MALGEPTPWCSIWRAPGAAKADIRVVQPDVQLACSLLNIPDQPVGSASSTSQNATSSRPLDVEGARSCSAAVAVTSPANVWGEDPADFARFYALARDAHSSGPVRVQHQHGRVGPEADEMISTVSRNQFAKLLAESGPSTRPATALQCVPNTPVSPITGIAGIDTSSGPDDAAREGPNSPLSATL